MCIRDLRTVSVEDVGELAAHRARANDDQRFWCALERQDFVRGEDVLLVEVEADLRQTLHARSGRDDDPLLGIVLLLLTVGGLHDDGLAAGEPARALDPGHLVLLEQRFDALGVLRADTARALHRWAII